MWRWSEFHTSGQFFAEIASPPRCDGQCDLDCGMWWRDGLISSCLYLTIVIVEATLFAVDVLVTQQRLRLRLPTMTMTMIGVACRSQRAQHCPEGLSEFVLDGGGCSM